MIKEVKGGGIFMLRIATNGLIPSSEASVAIPALSKKHGSLRGMDQHDNCDE